MRSHARPRRIGRRRFLQYATGAIGALGVSNLSLLASPATFAVGVGKRTSPYAAMRRAILNSGEWDPSRVAGKRVVIKPNLVLAAPASTGIVTHPESVRAVVDLVLAAGASEVKIVEGGNGAEKYTAAGYDGFSTYDPLGRIQLLDLDFEPDSLVTVPNGLAYGKVYMSDLLFGEDVFMISVAKLKVHDQAQVTLTMKNLFGLPTKGRYATETRPGRFAMHERSISQTVIDLNRTRPIDFAVVDASLGMEGAGPWGGTTVPLNLAFAGRNPLAVDLVCLDAMQVPLWRVQHLVFAATLGLGPSSTSAIDVRGDAFDPYPFALPEPDPVVGIPRPTPNPYSIASAGSLTLEYYVSQPCLTQVEIIRVSSENTHVQRIRLVRPWTVRSLGSASVSWDGRDDGGKVLDPGMYCVRVAARGFGGPTVTYAMGWLAVVA